MWVTDTCRSPTPHITHSTHSHTHYTPPTHLPHTPTHHTHTPAHKQRPNSCASLRITHIHTITTPTIPLTTHSNRGRTLAHPDRYLRIPADHQLYPVPLGVEDSPKQVHTRVVLVNRFVCGGMCMCVCVSYVTNVLPLHTISQSCLSSLHVFCGLCVNFY